MRAAVIAMGDELATGERLDTNSQWLSRELSTLGAEVCLHVTCPDDLSEALAAFRTAATYDVVIATGGLGPTADDLTREILAELSGKPLSLRADALADIEQRFSLRGMEMPESNRLQALFPDGSRMIPNPEGTAPGIDVILDRGARPCRLFALPGVPSEMRRMWVETVGPAILAMQPDSRTIRFRVLRCFGAGESAIESMLPDLIRRGRDPLVGITAHEATITLRIAARGRDEAECLAKITPTESTIRRCLGSLVFGTDDDEIEDAALAAASEAGWSLVTTERATNGLVASFAAAADARRLLKAQRAMGIPVEPRESRGHTPVFLGGVVLGSAPDDPGARRIDPVSRFEQLERDAMMCLERYGASLGLAVGAEYPDTEGRSVVPIVLVAPPQVAADIPWHAWNAITIEHRLAGSGRLRLARAAKTALDLVRLTCLGFVETRGHSPRKPPEGGQHDCR